ncbi:MAG: flagellar hook-length control protein FliK, partial [Deltaproteobacteria bacterium]|nr:flagellar hook-length control protein FliK [Deltaproteobacteria bacterium]
RGVISIEAFPIDIISNLPGDNPKGFTPSSKSGDSSFVGTFTRLTSDKSSSWSKSKRHEGALGIEKGEQGPGEALDDLSTEANLLGVSGQLVPDTNPQPQSQNDSGALQGTLSQNPGSCVQEGGINGNKDVVKDILSQLGFTQEEISSFFGAKDLSQLKELLLKLGLNASEAEHFMESNSPSLKDEEGLFLSKLVNALEQKGLSPDQAREIGKMITELNLELRQVDRPLAVEGQPRYAIKDLLLQLGIHPEDGEIPADRLNEILLNLGMNPEEGEIPLNRLSEILLKMGMSPEEVDKLAETGKLPVQDLKAFLIKMGINPEAAAGLVETGEHPGKEMSIRELLVLLRDLQNLSGGGAAHLVEKEGVSSGSDSTPHSGQGGVDLNGRGLMDVNSIVSGEIEGGKSQVDFEQVMSKTELREATSQKVMEQVVKVAKVQVVNGQARAKISLHPPTLGKLQMHIITEGNQVKATFFAETAQAKEIIENNLPQLRQSFLQQGLKVENFNVFVGNHPHGNQAEKQGFFNSGTAHNLGEGGPEGEDILAVEEMKSSAMGNHTVDLFI